jgi:hypothetical protein
MVGRILLMPVDQLRQAIQAALAAFDSGFVLTRNQPEAQACADHDST